MQIYLIVSLALGFFLYYSDELVKLCRYVRLHFRDLSAAAIGQFPWRKKKIKLKKLMKNINNGKKTNFIKSSFDTMNDILMATGGSGQLKQMKLISLVSGSVGVVIALSLKSFLLIPILGIGLALIPAWLIKFKMYRYELTMQNELSVVLSMVTNSYIRNENIVRAAEENLLYMNEPVKSIFSGFVSSSSLINPDITANLQVMKSKISNHVFKLWVENLIMCQQDINQKYSLDAVVNQFVADKELYNMLSAEISKPMLYLLVIIALSAIAFPLTVMIGKSFDMPGILSSLFTSAAGQLIIAGYILTILYGLNVAIDLSTQMD